MAGYFLWGPRPPPVANPPQLGFIPTSESAEDRLKCRTRCQAPGCPPEPGVPPLEFRPEVRKNLKTISSRWQTWRARQTRPRPNPIDPPLRSELFSAEQLARHARALAEG